MKDSRGQSNIGKPLNLRSGREGSMKIGVNFPWAKGFKVGNKTLYHPYCRKDSEITKEWESKEEV